MSQVYWTYVWTCDSTEFQLRKVLRGIELHAIVKLWRYKFLYKVRIFRTVLAATTKQPRNDAHRSKSSVATASSLVQQNIPIARAFDRIETTNVVGNHVQLSDCGFAMVLPTLIAKAMATGLEYSNCCQCNNNAKQSIGRTVTHQAYKASIERETYVISVNIG
jgi:hypothetical protein